jgi:membrane protease YdiL (CAAX protease family)
MAVLGAIWAEQPRVTILGVPASPTLQVSPALARGLLGIAAGWILALLTVRATRVLVARTQWAKRLHAAFRCVLLGTSAPQLALLSGLAALSEELFFRAALGPAIGFVASSALFGIVHLNVRDVQLPGAMWAFAMGLAFSGLYLLSGTLLAPILTHWLINYENMQYICSYDPTPRDIERVSLLSRYRSDR